MHRRVAVIGSSGFVGSAVVSRLRARGADVTRVRAPRLSLDTNIAQNAWSSEGDVVDSLSTALQGCDVVVNCAGDPNASSRDVQALFGANAALPGIISYAAQRASADRLIHVSSAAVQGAVPVLDASRRTEARSVYAQSKILGEAAVLAAPSPDCTVIYRPPSVHSQERRVTRGIRRLAQSPLASVVGPGDAPTPQAHIVNVADAVAELALSQSCPPEFVIHPWEGWTTGDLMRAFGGREPLHIPAVAGPAVRAILRWLGRWSQLAANTRRVEMMWFGQGQEESWLTEMGWTPPAGRNAWHRTIQEIDAATRKPTQRSPWKQ